LERVVSAKALRRNSNRPTPIPAIEEPPDHEY
jgi:hypothetical protein